jgi:N-formylglutamate deformylase
LLKRKIDSCYGGKVKLYDLCVPPEDRVPLVASLPHSGSFVPPEVNGQFDADPRPALVPLDWHLDKLYDFLPELGITVIRATHSRYVVNLNRSLTEPLFGPERSCVIPENTCFGKPLFDRPPSREKIRRRLDRYYTPYHRELAGIIENILRDFGHVYLVDLHSYYRGPEVDVCLGDVNGTTSSGRFTGTFENCYRQNGFDVVRNELWVGGYITRHYGSLENVEALQIELRFPAYLEGRSTFEEDEVPACDSDKFWGTRSRVRRVFASVVRELFDTL